MSTAERLFVICSKSWPRPHTRAGKDGFINISRTMPTMKSSNVLLFGSSLVIMGLGPPAITMAQETALEEVIVTAQKRQERLIDVPVSIAAISGEELQERGLSSIQDIDRKSTRLNSSHVAISYAVFCLKKKKN